MVTFYSADAGATREAGRGEDRARADVIGRQIEATDRQIDCLVYELYGLTEEEIAIVEGNR
ncbi:MAG: hypothetical protein LC781_09890 [Actinobacteria bacterium]|nr:hypothetical protein [Actinomycetota bacterium]